MRVAVRAGSAVWEATGGVPLCALNLRFERVS